MAWQTQRVGDLPVELAESTVHKHAISNNLNSDQIRVFKRLSYRLFQRSLDDCHGACLLKRPELAKIERDAILFYEAPKYDLDRFDVMPNHVHSIVDFRVRTNLTTDSQRWIRYAARRIKTATGRSGVFWQPETFDHIIRSPEQLKYLQRYITENPNSANLRDGEFLYWERV